jgi:hypothetical protein
MNPNAISADMGSAAGVDFVSLDAANLASHMNRCESARGRFFTLRMSWQSCRDVLSGRIVTVAAGLAVAAALIAFV